MVGVDSGSLYRWTHSLSCLAWSWVGDCLAPFYIHQINRVNSRNGSATMTCYCCYYHWQQTDLVRVNQHCLTSVVLPNVFIRTVLPQAQNTTNFTIIHISSAQFRNTMRLESWRLCTVIWCPLHCGICPTSLCVFPHGCCHGNIVVCVSIWALPWQAQRHNESTDECKYPHRMLKDIVR